jgi:sulfane dehydrogenase subunit SoxC
MAIRPQDTTPRCGAFRNNQPGLSMPRSRKPVSGERPASLTRRRLLASAAGVIGAGIGSARAARTQAPPADPTKVQGAVTSDRSARSAFEAPKRRVGPTSSQTPLQDLYGIITPADLHYERHHGGVPTIDPARYTLLVHGMVDRPRVFTLDDLRRFPSASTIRFLECSGNFSRNAPERTRPEEIAGLTSTNEWTGVPLATILREVGVRSGATWFLAEGQDAAVLARSIPVEKAWDDALIAYAQNGEALRPSNGYPVRLLLPGWEGNSNVKWLRRLEFADQPFMTREETSKYTEALKDGTVRQFSFVMDARSLITSPAYPERVQPGWIEIRGLAWSGRGRISRADISVDDGATWVAAELQTPVLPKAHTRFRHLWKWDGRETVILSRAVDETGYVQPTQRELIAARGPGGGPYHLNPITGWRLRPTGEVVYRTEAWA